MSSRGSLLGPLVPPMLSVPAPEQDSDQRVAFCPAALPPPSLTAMPGPPGVAAGLGNERSTLIKIKGRCSNLVVTKCCNVVLMVDEIGAACTVSESEYVSIIVRGTFPSPLTIRGVNGLHFTCVQNNVHSSLSGMWHRVCAVLRVWHCSPHSGPPLRATII